MEEISNETKFLENYKKKITKEFTRELIKNFKVYNNNNTLVNEKDIMNIICAPKILNRCIGTTSTGIISQCTRNAIDKFDYCKTHMYKIGYIKNKEETDTIIYIENVQNTKNDRDTQDLKKKFINDSFYYVDDKFIYDKFNNKVGYINNQEYILSSDPFILNESSRTN